MADGDLDAGDFGSWLRQMQAALDGAGEMDVPCHGCTACCTASQFIPIAPDETDTLARIPRELLVAAPKRPAGHVVLGYDERGHCPMLVDGRCSIYAHRPRACRVYDCRVFAAAGVDLDEPGKAAVAERVGRWRFGYRDETDLARHAAIRAAAAFVADHRDAMPQGAALSATGRAVAAIDAHAAFLDADGRAAAPDPHTVRVFLNRRAPLSSN